MTTEISLRERKIARPFVYLCAGVLALSACSQETQQYPKIEGKVTATECKKPVRVVSGTYPKSEIKQVLATDAAINKNVCLSAYSIGGLVLTAYQANQGNPNEHIDITAEPQGNRYMVRVIDNPGTANEIGAYVTFAATKNQQPDLSNIEEVTVWQRTDMSLQQVEYDVSDAKKGWGVRDWSALTTVKIPGLDLQYVDTTTADSLGMRKQPSLSTLKAQQATVAQTNKAAVELARNLLHPANNSGLQKAS